MIKVKKLVNDPHFMLGVVEVINVAVKESTDELKSQANEIAATILAPDYALPEEKRRAMRNLLKTGGFSPTGRNKPAHEFLIKDIRERGEFNFINNVVDVNNVISLKGLVPISIFDAGKVGTHLTVRIGEPGEGYVFNPSGHVLDVKKCIVCCRGEEPGEPIGTPVKDSMETKVFEGAGHILGVMYLTTDNYGTYELLMNIQQFADILARETGGHAVQAQMV